MARKESILVVDDERSIAEVLELILGEQGYRVATAQTAEQAERLAAERPFNLAFFDLRLPDASGIELLTRLRAIRSRTYNRVDAGSTR